MRDGLTRRAQSEVSQRRVLLNRKHHAAEQKFTKKPTAEPTVWLLTTGWRRHGLLRFDERPG